MLQFLLFTCCCITISLTHNIDLKVGPILKTNTAASYFGFSATGVIDSFTEPWVAVGSPRANTSKLDQKNKTGESTGAMFNCPITMDQSDCTDMTEKFQSFVTGNQLKYNPSNGWYGVSVSGGRQQDGKLMGQMLQPTAIFLEIKSIGDVVTWTIPSFPVLNLNFKKTAAVIRGWQKPIVFEEARSVDIEVGDKIRCTKWCEIVMNDVTFLVAWEFEKITKSVAQVDEEMAEVYAEEISEDQSNVVEHTSPFKVLGIMYKERQTYLKAASDSLAGGQNVEVAIRPEPGNEHDRNAIAVSLNYGSGWRTVGYIAKELTCYLHPLINNGSLRVAIANLRFRVTHFLLGYYLTISITKNGVWCDQVVKASKKVS